VTRHGPPSELRRLAAPVVDLIDAAWQRMHWWVATMAVLYALSGVTIVKPDETAVILRWGRLVGDTPALQEHGPGLLFAFPRPVDQVMRVQVKHVWEVPVNTLDAGAGANPGAFSDEDEASPGGGGTLDPLTQGYAVTADHNIVQVQMVARYRVREPAEWAFYGPTAADVLRAEVTAAVVRSLGEMEVDRVLSDGRKNLIVIATRRAQAGLDAAHAGLELSSLEFTRLSPPQDLAGDFSAVQSAFINAETMKKDAQTFAEGMVPRANAEADAGVQAARAAAANDVAVAAGQAAAFKALDKEYRLNPVVVRERLYRDAVEQALRAANVRWVPPPVGGKYNGFRVTVPPAVFGPRPRSGGGSEPPEP
jgi:membrane protease subunit HflK